jgi:hypothetical protein
MGKKNKKDYDSTTPEPFKPGKSDHTDHNENPDKTKKIEKSDPTRKYRWDITSEPDNSENKKDEKEND